MSATLFCRLKEDNFDAHTFDNSIPALVFFGAWRCKICKEQLPVVKQIAAEYTGKLNIFLVDVDKDEPLFHRFRLKGIPNMLLFSEGEVREQIRGLNSKEVLMQIINQVIE